MEDIKIKKTENIAEYRKQYYEKNKEKLTKLRKINKEKYYKNVECDICKKQYQKHHKTIHVKTKDHIIAELKQMVINSDNQVIKE